MSVVAAVERDLGRLDVSAREGALAATALELAAQLDEPENSATSKSMCARALTETLEKLRALAPPEERPKGKLYELRANVASRSSA